MALRLIMRSPKTRKGMMTTKEKASVPPLTKAIMIEKIKSKGARTAMRMIIMKAIWALLTSVVIRVTREVEENLSMFSKE